MSKIVKILLILIVSGALCMPQTRRARTEAAKPQAQQSWPHSIPLRIRDTRNKDLFVMTLGDVDTSIKDGSYDPVSDQVTLNDGTITRNYYRDTLGIKFYQPIDKARFALPPSGWCTWYYYYQQIDEQEVKQNALWIAQNLRDYGAQYVQIDDGWQGTGRGSNRDWTIVNDRFPSGMDGLAAYIKSLKLTPGIWLAPHGQSNESVVKNHPGVFLLNADGTSASETWEGKYLVDPSNSQSLTYLKDLFTKL